VHVRKGDQLAKFRVEPEVELVSAWGLDSRELSALAEVVKAHEKEIRRKWYEYFGS